MLFRFLRKFFYDEEFEKLKIRVEGIENAIQQLQAEIRNQQEMERERVEPDFIFFVWTAIGVALAIFFDAAQNFTPGTNRISFWTTDGIWSIVGITSMVFVILSSFIGISLIWKYAKSKSDTNYRFFATILTVGLILVVFSVFALAFLIK